MNVKHNMDIVGQKYFNNKKEEFVVINKYTAKDNRNRNGTVYDVKFLKTGYISRRVRRQELEKGQVKDFYAPSIANVGCHGDIFVPTDKTKIERYLYETWKNMLYRCYVKTCKAYKWYGAKGVTVCDRWLRYEYFFEDCKMLKGYDEQKILNGELDIDKDMISQSKIYSPETCWFVSKFENRKEAADRRWNKIR